MNIYKMEYEEIKKYERKFMKCVYGRVLKMMAFIPIFVSCFILVTALFDIVINDSVNIGIYYGLELGSFAICIAISCVAQIMYYNVFKDYVSSLKDEKKKNNE